MKWFSVDRSWALAYLGLGVAACGRLPRTVVPTGAVPASVGAAEAWLDSARVRTPVLHHFRFQLQESGGGSGGGRGTARIASGDSLRFDVAGPLGSWRGAAFVIGDSAQWAEPEDEVRKLVPNYPLLWAILGVPRPPRPLGEVSRFSDERVVSWRFVSGADTIEYAWWHGAETRLLTQVRHGGELIGHVETVFGPDGGLARSRLTVPSGPARLDVRYVATTKPDAFPADVWAPPAP